MRMLLQTTWAVRIWVAASLALFGPRAMGDNWKTETTRASSASASEHQTLQTSFSLSPEKLDKELSSLTTATETSLLVLMSSAIFQAPSGELKTSILHKLLSSAQLQLLAKGEKQDEHEADDISSGDVEDDSSTLNTVHFVGLSPDFAAVLRKLYRAAVHEESSISVDRRQRRQAQGAVDAEILNIEKEGNGTTVTLDFLLEQDGNLVPMETALANLQQLSEDEMEALLQVPVVSPVEVVRKTTEQAGPTSSKVFTHPATKTSSLHSASETFTTSGLPTVLLPATTEPLASKHTAAGSSKDLPFQGVGSSKVITTQPHSGSLYTYLLDWNEFATTVAGSGELTPTPNLEASATHSAVVLSSSNDVVSLLNTRQVNSTDNFFPVFPALSEAPSLPGTASFQSTKTQKTNLQQTMVLPTASSFFQSTKSQSGNMQQTDVQPSASLSFQPTKVLLPDAQETQVQSTVSTSFTTPEVQETQVLSTASQSVPTTGLQQTKGEEIEVQSPSLHPTHMQQTTAQEADVQSTVSSSFRPTYVRPTKVQSTKEQTTVSAPPQPTKVHPTTMEQVEVQPTVSSSIPTAKGRLTQMKPTISLSFQPTNVLSNRPQPTKLAEAISSTTSTPTNFGQDMSETRTPLVSNYLQLSPGSSLLLNNTSSSLRSTDTMLTTTTQTTTGLDISSRVSSFSLTMPGSSESSGVVSSDVAYDQSERQDATQVQTVPTKMTVSSSGTNQSLVPSAVKTDSTVSTVDVRGSAWHLESALGSVALSKESDLLVPSFSIEKTTQAVFLTATFSVSSSSSSSSRPSFVMSSVTLSTTSNTGDVETSRGVSSHASDEPLPSDYSVSDVFSAPFTTTTSQTPVTFHTGFTYPVVDNILSSTEQTHFLTADLFSIDTIAATSYPNTQDFTRNSEYQSQSQTLRTSPSSVLHQSHLPTESSHSGQENVSSMNTVEKSVTFSKDMEMMSVSRAYSEETFSTQHPTSVFPGPSTAAAVSPPLYPSEAGSAVSVSDSKTLMDSMLESTVVSSLDDLSPSSRRAFHSSSLRESFVQPSESPRFTSVLPDSLSVSTDGSFTPYPNPQTLHLQLSSPPFTATSLSTALNSPSSRVLSAASSDVLLRSYPSTQPGRQSRTPTVDRSEVSILSESDVAATTTPVATPASWYGFQQYSSFEASDSQREATISLTAGVSVLSSLSTSYSPLPDLVDSEIRSEASSSFQQSTFASQPSGYVFETQQSQVPQTTPPLDVTRTPILQPTPSAQDDSSSIWILDASGKDSHTMSPRSTSRTMQTFSSESSHTNTAVGPTTLDSFDLHGTLTTPALVHSSSGGSQASDISPSAFATYFPTVSPSTRIEPSTLNTFLPSAAVSVLQESTTSTQITPPRSASSEFSDAETTSSLEDLPSQTLHIIPTSMYPAQSATFVNPKDTTVAPSESQSTLAPSESQRTLAPSESDLPTAAETPTPSQPVVSASSSYVTGPEEQKPTSFLRIRIRVDSGVDVTSPSFLAWIRQALTRLYLAALRAKTSAAPSGRHRRQAEEEVQTQVLDVERDATNNSVVSLDFSVSEDQQQVPADTALNTLQTLTNQQMSVIIKYPVISLTKEVSVNATLTIVDPSDSLVIVVTKSGVEFVVPRDTLTTTATVPVMSYTATPSFTLPYPTATTTLSVSGVSSTPTFQPSTSLTTSSDFGVTDMTPMLSSEHTVSETVTSSGMVSAEISTLSVTVTPAQSVSVASPATSLVEESSSDVVLSSTVSTNLGGSSIIPSLSTSEETTSESPSVTPTSTILGGSNDVVSNSASSTSPSEISITPSSSVSEESMFSVSPTLTIIPTPSSSSSSSDEITSFVETILSPSSVESSYASAFESSSIPEPTSSVETTSASVSEPASAPETVTTTHSTVVAETTQVPETSDTLSVETTIEPTSVVSSTTSVKYSSSEVVESPSVTATSEIGPTSTSVSPLPESTQSVVQSSTVSTGTTDSLPVSLSTTDSLPVSLSTTDSLPFSPSTTDTLPFSPSTTDTLLFSPSTVDTLPFSPSASDSVSVSPSATDSVPISPSATDSASVSASSSSTSPLPSTLSEVIETTRTVFTSSDVQPTSVTASETSTVLVISPSPTTTTTTPSSSVAPTTSQPPTTTPSESLRDALMMIDIEVKVTEDEQSEGFRDKMRKGLALVYREALASRKKRSVPADDVILHVRQHRDARSRRQAENGVAAEVTEVTRNGTDPRVTNVTFYVMKDGTPVPASEASVTINKFSPNAISAIIAYPVVSSYVRPVYAVSPTQPGEFDDGAGVLFVVAIVLPSILLLLLMVVLSVFLLRACRPPPPASPADVVPTKYQRGESLDDYNLHVDVERGEIVDLTPHPTPDPNFRRPSKSKSKSSRKSDITTFAPTKEDTLDSKRHMIDKWLQGDHARPRGSVESVESMARSDTFLYSKQSASRSSREAGSKEEKKRKQRARSRHLEVPQEPYKEYLQALRLPESDIDGRDGEHGDHDRSTESFAMEERNVDGEQLQDSERSRSPPAGKQDSPPPLPRAKPRTSFVGKLRESIRKRKRSTTPEYNSMTQSTLVSALADSAQTLPGSHDTTSVDLEESRDEDTHHTDASDEFTVVVPMSRGGSRDRLGSSSTCASPVNAEQRQTDVQGDGGGGAQSRLNLDPSAPTKRTPSKSNLKKSRPGPPATLDSSVQTADSFKDPAGDDCGLLLDARAVKSQEELSKEGYSATATRTMQTQTSFASNSDVSTDSGVTVTSAKKKSVAVGRNTVNVRTQTPKEEKRTKAKRKSGRTDPTHISAPTSFPSAASTERLIQSDVSMEEEQMEEELPPMMRIEPFAKMSQILPQHQDRQVTLPVKFRRNVLEESPQAPPEDDDFRQGTDIQAYHKPARHMRAQPRVSYGAMDPDQRRQAELRDTALSRQQLLLRQQQEVMAYTHQQQVEQQAQHLVNSTFAVKTSSATTGAPAHQQHHSDRERLGSLLNEACVLAPQPVPGTAWTPTQMPVISQGYYNPVTVLPNTGVPVSAIPPPGAPGPLMFLGRDELMQQVRKELRRMQQE